MNALLPVLVGWLLLPLMLAFLAALLPALGRWLVLLSCLASLGIGALLLQDPQADPLPIFQSPQVALQLDVYATGFLLANGLITLAVLLQSWRSPRHRLTWVLLMVLHGAINSVVLAVDAISIYVAIELVAISAFLLVIDPARPDTFWVAFRYLLISDLAMLVYLIGVQQAYRANGSFAFAEFGTLPLAALALMAVGLMSKAGVFLTGFWLPVTHARAPAEISALLSGLVVTAGAAPLGRLQLISPSLGTALMGVGLASAVIGIAGALVQDQYKRLLAWSTVSQLGLVLVLPAGAGVLCLAHGLAKGALFLVAGRLGTLDLSRLRGGGLPTAIAIPIAIAALSLTGFPPLLGYGAKSALAAGLDGPWARTVELLSIGTVAVFAQLVPWPGEGGAAAERDGAADQRPADQQPSPSAGPGPWLLVAALVALPLWLSEAPSVASIGKSALTLAVGLALGWGCRFLRRGWSPPDLERFEDLVNGFGVTALVVGLALWGLRNGWF